jgi:pSer/pThr/pTyr-binding forkhead associated (FHA) protein
VRVRKMPQAEQAAASAPAKPAAPPVKPKAAPRSRPGGPATTSTVSKLVITSGPKAGLEVPLGSEPMSIGRSSESGLVIRDDNTSSQHARLMLWGEQWMLQDLDSTNGTFLDGQRVGAPVAVPVGAPIKVGATTFELRA